ncbi:MAG TPA: MlaD family protein [Acidobacteriota bacterium]|nr:MlaD family protein [Acidobacteriota bacterium]
MEGKRRPTFSELRVGIFVVVACAILAVAIFTIGTQVGLFEKTFIAKTYLNNVSGLKPGDIVRLGGVEVGNITRVEMSPAGVIPDTQTNQQTLARLNLLNSQAATLQNQVQAAQQNASRLEADYQAAVADAGADSEAARQALRRLEDARDRRDDLESDLESAREDIEQARAQIQNIAVYMQLTEQHRDWIRNDSSISLGNVGLLGDKYIEISLGRTDEQPPVVTELVDGAFGTEEREVVVITGQTQSGFQELITGANDVLANFELLSGKLVRLIDQFEEGEGSVGRFFNDPSFYNNLNAAVESARQTADEAARLLREVTEGEGTIPTLIQSRELHDKVVAMTDDVGKVLKAVQEGQGTIGRLINEREVYDKANRMLGNVEEITARMQRGEGTLGKLSKDEQLYTDLRDSIDRLSAILEDVEQGRGTLGRLAKDEQLYRNVNELSSEMVKLLYDFRQNPKRFLTIKFELF